MTLSGWLQIVYLLMAVSLPFAAYRAYNVGGKKTLAYALIWAAIFGIAALFASMVAG